MLKSKILAYNLHLTIIKVQENTTPPIKYLLNLFLVKILYLSIQYN